MSRTVNTESLEKLLHRIEDRESTPEQIQEALADAFPGEEFLGTDEAGDFEDEPGGYAIDDSADTDEERGEEQPQASAPARSPQAALAGYREGGGTDDELVEGYMAAYSQFHILRTTSQPTMLRTLLRTLVPAMARRLSAEAGVDGLSAMLLAEQAAEARVEEAHYRALAGTAMDELKLGKVERWTRLADKSARRMMKALEQLHRLKRPKVSVRIAQANNVNLGEQKVVGRPDGEAGEVVEEAAG